MGKFAGLFLVYMSFVPTLVYGQVSAVIGFDTSSGTGERPGVVLALDTKREGGVVSFENMVSFDSAEKIQGGWKAANYSAVRLGKRYGAVVGIDLCWRDGGPWVKRTAWSVAGFSVRNKSSEIVLDYRLPVYESFPNDVRVAEARLASPFKPGSRFGIRTHQGMVFFKDYRNKPERYGWFSMVALTIAVKKTSK